MSKILTLEQIKQEELAQSRRDVAKAYLEGIGQSIEKVDTKKASKGNDNTLELLLSEKRKNIVNSTSTSTSTSTTTSNKQIPLASSNEKLQSGWQAVNDKTGKTYYWNIVTNETTWEKPVLNNDTSISVKKDLPPHWIEKVHSATFQSYWVHEKTGIKRWEMPAFDDDGTLEIPTTTSISNKRTNNTEIENNSKKQRSQPASIGPTMKK